MQTEAGAVTQLATPLTRGEFTVVGPQGRFEAATTAAIPGLWQRLVKALPVAGQRPGWATYGVIWNAHDQKVFNYIAGVEVEAGTAQPEGFGAKTIAASTYVVFRITLHGGPLHPQVKAAMAMIRQMLLPRCGWTVAGGPQFEFYDGQFSPERAGAVIDFHVPIVR